MKWMLVALSFGLAFADSEKSYRIGTHEISFLEISAENILISSSCWPGKKCEAFRSLTSVLPPKASPKSSGGIEPGARVCTSLKGQVLIGKDKDGNEVSFCSFRDASLISCSSLWTRALKNTKL